MGSLSQEQVQEQLNLKSKSKFKVSSFISDLSESDLSKNIRENSNSIFEIIPKLIIEPEEEVEDVISRFALSSGGTYGGGELSSTIVLDSELFISPKLNKDNVDDLLKLPFESAIDFIVWRRSLLIVGLDTSEIILINPRTLEIRERRKVCPKMVGGGSRYFVDAFLHSNKDPEKIDIIVVNVNCIVYSFLNISLSDGSLDFTHDENVSFDVDATSIKVTVKKYLEESAKVVSVASPTRDFLITAEEDGHISIFKLYRNNNEQVKTEISEEMAQTDFVFFNRINLFETLSITTSLSRPVNIVKILRFEGLLFVLLSTGLIEILFDDLLYPTEPLHLPKETPIIQDFCLVLSPSGVKLWAICSNHDTNQHYIGIFKGPGFELEFFIKIPVADDQVTTDKKILKFPSLSSAFEEPYCILEKSNGTIKYYEMTETSKEITFKRLLDKGLFEKAAILAEQYGQDIDLVNKAKLEAKAKELIHNSKGFEKAEIIFQDLVKILHLISDAVYICKFCEEFNFSDNLSQISWVKELLNIGQKRAFDCNKSIEAKRMLLTRKKFFTFEQVFASGSVKEWNYFNGDSNTMFLQSKDFLDKEEFKKSETVWLRHLDEFFSELSINHFAHFYWKLFSKRLGSSEGQSLFKAIFPTLLDKYAEENTSLRLENMMELVKRQVLSLERETTWPTEACAFSKILISILEAELGKLVLLPKTEKKNITKVSVCQEILKETLIILQNLNELADLKSSYSILVPYITFTQESEFEVVNSMLNKLFFKDEINQFVTKFLEPFAKKKHLDVNVLFSEHIKTVTGELMGFFNETDIPFEERLISLIDFIRIPKMKLDSVLIMASEWPVPWSEPMMFLVNNILKMPLNQECSAIKDKIKMMKQQIPYRCIMQKYRLKSKTLQTELGVELALKRILASKKDNCYADCLELIKHTGRIDTLKFQVLKIHNDILKLDPEDIDILDIPYDNIELIERLLFWILCEFNFKLDLWDIELNKPNYWNCISKLGKSISNRLGNERALNFFRLREAFPTLTKLSYDTTSCSSYPLNILEIILKDHVDDNGIEGVLKKIQKLGSIANFPQNDLILVSAYQYIVCKKPIDQMKPEVWDFVKILVESPDTQFYLNQSQEIALSISRYLMSEPNNNYGNVTLKFLQMILKSKSELNQPIEMQSISEFIAKFLTAQRIFATLRKKEIPLEAEFMIIYQNTWCFARKEFDLLKKLEAFGETLLKYGERDLLVLVFNSIYFEIASQPQPQNQDSSAIIQLKENLLENIDNYQYIEDNPEICRLVSDLNKSGIIMNAYALQRRDKSKLLDQLVELELYSDAMKVAVVFENKEHSIWAKILNGLMKCSTKESIKVLREVLEKIQNVTELWMLKEFSVAWLKVSTESDPSFKNICPIPLD